MAAQGLEVTTKVKISVLQCDPDIFDDQYIFFLHIFYYSGHTALISGPKLAESP